jgi:hypothetical protein
MRWQRYSRHLPSVSQAASAARLPSATFAAIHGEIRANLATTRTMNAAAASGQMTTRDKPCADDNIQAMEHCPSAICMS